MKTSDLKKMQLLRRWFSSRLVTSFKRALRINADESEPASDLHVSMKGLPDTFLIYDGHQRINAQFQEMEMHKAEAIQSMRERTRCA